MKYQGDSLRTFSKQIAFVLANYTPHGLNLSHYSNIILSGLGGSGIAGRIVKSYFFSVCPKPIEVVSDYNLPKYASGKTLAIMSSYSGNTEETLEMYNQAKALGCSIIVISTGGKLVEMAKSDGFGVYLAEKGHQPRMALGYSLSYLQLIFSELLGLEQGKALQMASEKLSDSDSYIEQGRNLLSKFINHNHKFCVVTDYFSNPIGLRFCQQIQENAKNEAFLSELPEANHNVIESYYGAMDTNFLFLNSGIQPRTELRFSFLKNLLERKGNKVIEIKVSNSNLTEYLETIYALDWVSLLIADKNGTNSSDIQNINALKDYLGAH